MPAADRCIGDGGADYRHMLPLRAQTERRLLLLAMLPGLWLALSMPVFAQESYYWTYAQHPDLSYFDHPPMVAWLIWLGTQVLGNGVLGIRFATCGCGIGTLLIGLALLRAFGASEAVRRAWIVFSSCVPILVMTRFLANPDPPLALFWSACLLALWKARDGSLAWWFAAGVAAGCALLSKYTAAFLAVGGGLVLLFDPKLRRQLRRPGPWLGVVIAAITFLPVVLWNVNNEFESFRFQTSGRWERARLSTHWISQFLGLQFLVLNPFLAVLLPTSIAWLWRRWRGRGGDGGGGANGGTAEPDLRALWLLAFGLPLPLFFLANSLIVQVKINWLVPAYLPLVLGMSLWWGESDFTTRRPVLARRLARGVVTVLAVIGLIAPLIRLVPQQRGSSWDGWDEVAASACRLQRQLDAEDQVAGNVFFFAADYKDAAQLTRALRQLDADGGAALPPVLAQNVLGDQALQFDHWEAPARHRGENAVFVLPRADDRQGIVDKVQLHFASIERREQVEVRRLGIAVLMADLYVARDYRGPEAGH